MTPMLLAALSADYSEWKTLPDGRIVAVTKLGSFTYGKSRVVVNVNEYGYQTGY